MRENGGQGWMRVKGTLGAGVCGGILSVSEAGTYYETLYCNCSRCETRRYGLSGANREPLTVSVSVLA